MMTEKRFVNKGKDIFQYGEWWCSANGEHCADVIATAMNELIEENEQLKKAMTNEYNSTNMVTVLKTEVNDLTKENKELKQELGKLAEFNQKAIW